MGNSYEVVVLVADRTALLRQLENLPEKCAPVSFDAYRVAERCFAIYGWREGIRHLSATEEIEDMAAVLSLEFDQALAVHYDTMLGVREATLYQSGKPIRSFGEEDELWAPTDCNGAALPDAPRCPSSEIPKDADYDFVWDGIDAGIEVAGFGGWLTAYDLTAGFHGDDLLWQRNGSIP